MLCTTRTCSRKRTVHRLFNSLSSRGYHDSPGTAATSPILHLENTNIFSLSDPNKPEPILRDVSWTIQPHEAWAVLSVGYGCSKRTLFKALFGERRIHPLPPQGIFPFLRGLDPQRHVRMTSFARARGDFFDYTARYGAIRDEDQQTLRDLYFPEAATWRNSKLALPALYKGEWEARKKSQGQTRRARFEMLIKELKLQNLLDVPVVALSNGQTRRAQIAKVLMGKSALLMLDEPLTGLDTATRHVMVDFLHQIHTSAGPGDPHLILGMRRKDPMPEWITHIALVTSERTVVTGTKEELKDEIEGRYRPFASIPAAGVVTAPGERPHGYDLVQLSNLNVQYGDRHVLQSINWTIRENSRWQLMGANGAGKTTLLAMLTGEHLQSFAQSHCLRLFGRPRNSWPTIQLNQRIGRVSPELNAAFPRRAGMTVWDVVGTGFTGEFVPRGRRRVGMKLEDGTELEPDGPTETWRVRRMWQVLEGLGPRAWTGRVPDGNYEAEEDKAFALRQFIDLAPGEQSMVLLMRALVGRALLVLLDEVWSGMDEGMIQAVWRYLADGGGGLLQTQACVVVSHWEDEIPWSKEQGLKKFLLQDGEGREVD